MNTRKYLVAAFLLLSSLANAQLSLDWSAGSCPAYTGGLYPYDMKVDQSGYSYVCGKAGSAPAACIRKVDPLGNEVWLVVFDSLSGSEEFHSIVLDDYGFLYVTGVIPQGSYQDVVTCKYDTSGNRIWCRTYNGPDMKEDQGWKIAFAPNGDLIVGGNSYYNSNNVDPLAISYSTNGNQNWATAHNVWFSTGDYNRGLSVDANGNIYLAQFGGSVCSLDSTGVFRWSTVCTPSNTVQDFVGDPFGNTYVVGMSGSSAIINKFDQFGNQNWDTAFAPHSTDLFIAACLDSSFNFYAAGRMNTHYIVVSLDSLKNTRWTYGGQYLNSQITHITARKNIVALSGDFNNISNDRALTGAIDTSGIFIGDDNYLTAGAMWSRNYPVCIDSSLNILTAAQQLYNTTTPCTEILNLKYHVSALGLTSAELPRELFSIFPDPSGGDFTVNFADQTEMYSISIIDLYGREIFWRDKQNANTELHLDCDPGIYFMIVSSAVNPGRSQTRKLIIR